MRLHAGDDRGVHVDDPPSARSARTANSPLMRDSAMRDSAMNSSQFAVLSAQMQGMETALQMLARQLQAIEKRLPKQKGDEYGDAYVQ